MGDEKYFAQALTNFTRNFAYGDAICHLVDKGYTTDKIMREFQYPLPKDTIDRMVTDHLIDLVSTHFKKNDSDLVYLKEITEDKIELWAREDAQLDLMLHSKGEDSHPLRSLSGNKLCKVLLSAEHEQLYHKLSLRHYESGQYLKLADL